MEVLGGSRVGVGRRMGGRRQVVGGRIGWGKAMDRSVWWMRVSEIK